jgi:hypothetical protein
MTLEKYCKRCGSELVEHFSGMYNPHNGERIIGKHCPNLNCDEGCEYAGHIFPWYSHRCKRCGSVPYCYQGG